MEEIKNFTLSYNGVFWLNYADNQFMIYITPRQLAILFTQEGIDMKEVDDNIRMESQFKFNKAILIVSDRAFAPGELFDEENMEIGLVVCYAKVD